MNRLKNWAIDYLYMLHGHSQAFYVKEPAHYLGYVRAGKFPIILIPGIFSKWHFLKFFADPISHRGHPVYVVRALGSNIGEISHSAKIIRKLIDEKNLHDVIIIAHSKGGLIGKYLLGFLNRDNRIKKVIAIATPFGGSYMVKYFKLKALAELHPQSRAILELKAQREVNRHIVSVFGVFDNHVWPEASCRVEGAKNIEVNTHGHHKILFDKKVRDIVLEEVEKA